MPSVGFLPRSVCIIHSGVMTSSLQAVWKKYEKPSKLYNMGISVGD